jgi:hypothetical protein
MQLLALIDSVSSPKLLALQRRRAATNETPTSRVRLSRALRSVEINPYADPPTFLRGGS